MNVKQLLSIAAIAVAFSPLAARAESDIAAKDQAWLASLKSTRTVAEVRAALDHLVHYGEMHPVELQENKSTLTRAQVKHELAESGVIRVGA